ncbi:MAG: 30S processome protein Utp24 [Candidatus Nezhaarchaeota archaeon]|nr:30S processome protein Utp24 [Candidatus Nezhaarchaeota archaeon]
MLFDTNLLMMMFERPINIVGEVESLLEVKVEPVVLRAQLIELENISKSRRSKASKIARTLLDLIRRKFKVVEGFGATVDDAIVDVAKRGLLMVATNDWELRRKLRENGVTVIYLRRDGKIMVEGCAP